MNDLQARIDSAQQEIQLAKYDLQAAIALRKNAIATGKRRKTHDNAVAAAEAALDAAEVRLRALYEAKGDWVPLSQSGQASAAPAPIAVG